VGFLGLVEVDKAYHIRIADLEDFKKTVSERTWSAVQHYADEMKRRKVRVAFFSSTPQGGGVALMRHALLRFSKVLGTDLKWFAFSHLLVFRGHDSNPRRVGTYQSHDRAYSR
jgi:hypothetical protein